MDRDKINLLEQYLVTGWYDVDDFTNEELEYLLDNKTVWITGSTVPTLPAYYLDDCWVYDYLEFEHQNVKAFYWPPVEIPDILKIGERPKVFPRETFESEWRGE